MTRVPTHPLRAVPLVLAVAACLLTGCGSRHEQEPPQILPTASVRVQKVEDKVWTSVEEVAGTVRAKRRATLEARVSGTIDQLPVALGQRVKSGDLLAHLDAAEISARVSQATAALDQAENDWKRISGLFAQQAVSQSEYDAAQARLQTARAAAAEAQAMLSYVEIRAPFDGVVTRKWVDAGDVAAPGKPLLALEDPNVLQLEADIPEGIAFHVQSGAQLACHIDGLKGDIAGTVTEITSAADPASRTVRVVLDLPKTEGLASGQFGRLAVPVGESRAPHVAASALVQRGQLEMVFAVTNQHAQLRLVKTGRHDAGDVEVLSGLDAGEAVVIDGAAQLTDGQPVEVK